MNTKKVWKLEVEDGRQVWRPVEVPEDSPDYYSELEKHLLTKKCNDSNPSYENQEPSFSTPHEAAEKGIEFYERIQTEDGHWSGDYGGPLFLLPGFIIVTYICGVVFGEDYRKEMIRYICNTQREDGGWGLHIEGNSTIFGTCLNYISLRILGVPANDSHCVKGRDFLNKNGGVLGCPQWGKFYMCTLGVMEWEAIDPIPPELWLLPDFVPIVQPGKWWCHCRVVYLPMAYVYGKRGRTKETELIRQLREELYNGNYSSIQWSKYRGYNNPIDIYNPPSWIWKILSFIVSIYELVLPYLPPLQWLRRKSLEKCVDHIKYEDKNTKFICIGPVNKVLNMLSIFYAEGSSEHFKQHIDRLYDYLWLSDDGMKFQGYNGSQLWDTAFATQAILSTGMADKFNECLKKAHHYIDISQVREDADNLKQYYRHISNGAWPFSTRDHGWPISDCTAEGLKASLLLADNAFINNPISDERLFDAVNVIISMWNKGSGGWATYELSRTYAIAELFNPSALFGEIMIDYPHVECTSACIQALCAFRKKYPNHRTNEIQRCINGGIQFLKSRQKPDGLFYGCWAICFCYGTWFAVTAMITAGVPSTDPVIQKACKRLIELQNEDGGWGESHLSSVKHQYVSCRSQVVNTSWALMTLMNAHHGSKDVIDKGIQLLMRRQLPNGDFPQENISGVFNHNCAITYTNYRNLFPIWALGTYLNKYEQK